MNSLQNVKWGKLYENATSKASKQAKKGLQLAKRQVAEVGLAPSFRIGGKHVIVLRKLATGGFATVYKVRDNRDHREYAMKRIKTTQAPTQVTNTTDEAEREARLLAKMNHPNIIKCIAWEDHTHVSQKKKTITEIFLLLELCPDGHILDFIKEKVVLSPKDIVDCLFQTLDALHYLHYWQRFPIVHRDVKCENILRAKDKRWKLCDFGSMCCRKTLYPKDLSRKGLLDLQDEIDKKVTMLYRPPEMVDLTLSRDDYEHRWEIGPKVDVWMVGCVCFCLIFGTHPFQDSATPMAIRNAKYYLPISHANMNHKNLILLAQWFLSPLPEDRPSTGDALDILEKWQEKPDVYQLLPKSTQERLQKTWKLYGVKFSGPDKSSDGVYRQKRFEFVSKREEESPAKLPAGEDKIDKAPVQDSDMNNKKNEEIDVFRPYTQNTERIQTQVSGGLPEPPAPPPPSPPPPPMMMNLFDFDDDEEPAPVMSGGGREDDFNPFESAPAPIQLPARNDLPDFFSVSSPGPALGASPAASSSTMFDPFGGSPAPAALSGGAPNGCDDFDPFFGSASNSSVPLAPSELFSPPVDYSHPSASSSSYAPGAPAMSSPPNIDEFNPFVSASASSAPAPSIPGMPPPGPQPNTFESGMPTTSMGSASALQGYFNMSSPPNIDDFNPFVSASASSAPAPSIPGMPTPGPQPNTFESGMPKTSMGSAAAPQGDFYPFASVAGENHFSSPAAPAQSPSSAMPSFGGGMPPPSPMNQSFGAGMPIPMDHSSFMGTAQMGAAPSIPMTGVPMTAPSSPGLDAFVEGHFSTPAMGSSPGAQPPASIQGSNDFDLFTGSPPAAQPPPVAISNANDNACQAFNSFGSGFVDFNNVAPPF